LTNVPPEWLTATMEPFVPIPLVPTVAPVLQDIRWVLLPWSRLYQYHWFIPLLMSYWIQGRYCYHGAVCTNTIGSYHCSCSAGYKVVTLITQCYQGAICTNTIGSYHCSCPTGYKVSTATMEQSVPIPLVHTVAPVLQGIVYCR
jgi:hypothetical protein